MNITSSGLTPPRNEHEHFGGCSSIFSLGICITYIPVSLSYKSKDELLSRMLFVTYF